MLARKRRSLSGPVAALLVTFLWLAGCATPPSNVQGAPDEQRSPSPLDMDTVSPAEPGVDSASTEGMVPAVVGLPPDVKRSETYRIGPDDVLRIEVFAVDELSTVERVGEAGEIVMPLIGPVQVGGLTPLEAEAKIAAALAKDYLQDPQVNVFIRKYANLSFTVGGAVSKPGWFRMLGRTTLLEAVARAGGVTRVADRSELILFRDIPGSATQAYVIDLKKVETGELQDPVLASNDKIVVPESGSAVFVRGISDTLRGFVTPFGL